MGIATAQKPTAPRDDNFDIYEFCKAFFKSMTLPDELKQEADDFVEFLKTKIQEKNISKNKKAGLAKGLIEMKDDFDEPLEDFESYRE